MKNKISGLIMTIIGFLIILTNAIGYVFNVGIKNPALVIMGLVFVVIGMKLSKNSSKKS